MRTLNQLTTLLSILMALVSCSGGKPTASLEISKSFAMTTPYFAGGLIVTGKNPTLNKSFTIALTTSTSVKVQLDPGKWFFAAVAWDGGASNKKFSGEVYCAWSEADLQNSSATVNLTVTKEKCVEQNDGALVFGGGQVDTSTTPDTFRRLITVDACNSFYTSLPTVGTNPATIDASAGFSPGFCAGLPKDFMGDVKSFQIFSINKLPEQALPDPGFGTGCIASSVNNSALLAGTGNPYQGEFAPRLPYKNIPFMVYTYRENDCTRPNAIYIFRDGLSVAHQDFDHVLRMDNSQEVKLLLPANDVRRARSPFTALLPYFKRHNSGSPLPFETMPTSSTYHHFMAKRGTTPTSFIMHNESSCGTPADNGSSVTIDNISCSMVNGKPVVTLAASGTGDGTGEFVMNSQLYQVYFITNTSKHKRYTSQRLIAELLGKSNDNTPESFFWPNVRDNDVRDSGVLGEARDMLLSAGAILGVGAETTFQTACQNRVTDKLVQIFDFGDMALNSYRLVVTNSPVTEPNPYFCNIDDLSDGTCANVIFEKRMTIYDHSVSTLVPAMAFEFSCQKMIGRMEQRIWEEKDSRNVLKKEIVSWNTEKGSSNDLSNQRFEQIRMTEEYVSSTRVRQSRRLARVQKTAPNDFEVWSYDFRTAYDGASWKQEITTHQAASGTSTNIAYSVLREEATNASETYLLTNGADLSTAVATSSEGLEYVITDNWAGAQVASTIPFSNLVVEDVNVPSMEDDNNADLFDGSLPFLQSSLQNGNITSLFGTSFLTSP